MIDGLSLLRGVNDMHFLCYITFRYSQVNVIVLQRINSVNYTFEPLVNFSRVITFEEDPLIRPCVGILS